MNNQITFGVFMPQGWKMELVDIPNSTDKWSVAVDTALHAEVLGFDSIWVYDHFHNVPKPAHEAVFECWTVMAAISQRTTRIRLGQMVGCNLYRPPALLAKITSTLDVISGGRLDWGVGAGWYENECRGYGYEFPVPKDRIAMLKETVEIVKSMWTQPETTYAGKYYQTVRGNCDPKPIQKPHPPIWIGGGGEQLTLRVVAQYADYSNFGGTAEEFARKREILKGHCAKVGRDEEEIRKTWSPEILIRDSEQELKDLQARSTRGESFETWRASNLIGTPDQVGERIQKYIDLGCSGFIPWCVDYPSTQTMDELAKIMMSYR
ncbi:MAG: LLM class F420-dependent oxidoreductase [Ilumatobacteraceae bacterium]